MKRTASAEWTGDLQTGTGSLTTASKTLNTTPYSFKSRFEEGTGTNPEELIAAAHAGCFTMALSARLSKAGTPAEKLSTEAALTLEQVEGNWTITTIHLKLRANVPGIEKTEFDELVEDAKANCPVSKALNAKITLESSLNT